MKPHWALCLFRKLNGKLRGSRASFMCSKAAEEHSEGLRSSAARGSCMTSSDVSQGCYLGLVSAIMITSSWGNDMSVVVLVASKDTAWLM